MTHEIAPSRRQEDAAAVSAQTTGDGFKETTESIVVAFILAFVFRTFIIEAFVIPTGSMAATLYGNHGAIVCQDCGWENAYGLTDTSTRKGQYGPGSRVRKSGPKGTGMKPFGPGRRTKRHGPLGSRPPHPHTPSVRGTRTRGRIFPEIPEWVNPLTVASRFRRSGGRCRRRAASRIFLNLSRSALE